MKTFARAVLLVASVAASGCTFNSQPVEESHAASGAIQGGAPDTAHPEVGLLWMSTGSFCSGTLIAPDVVLTAGHCVADPVTFFYTGAGAANVDFKPAANMTKWPAQAQAAHPSYQWIRCPVTTFDLGLVFLSQPVTGIRPAAFATAGQRSALGTECLGVGFGTHTPEDGGFNDEFLERRAATESLTETGATYLTVAAGTGVADHGDSGGPLFCGGVIAGTTSCHTDGDWPSHVVEYYGRVDLAAEWIQAMVQQWHADGGVGQLDAGIPVIDAGAAVDAGARPGAGPDGGSLCHDLCATGAGLSPACDPVLPQVCAQDPVCCSTKWDAVCVRESGAVCTRPDAGVVVHSDAGVVVHSDAGVVFHVDAGVAPRVDAGVAPNADAGVFHADAG